MRFWLGLALCLWPTLTKADDGLGTLFANLIIFDAQCNGHAGQVWKYSGSGYAIGCTPTSQAQLLTFYEQQGNTTAAQYQRLGLEARSEKLPLGILGAVLGVLPGFALLSAYPPDKGNGGEMTGLVWLAVTVGGGILGYQGAPLLSKHADVDPQKMFIQALNTYNAGLEVPTERVEPK